MPKKIILIHGYSVRSLDTYGIMPQLLAHNGFSASDIYLSAFDSLNDDITCDDLARALEVRIAELESKGLDLADTAIIVHSTGAIVTRRWLLNRFAQKRSLPSHFISLAGANHGSTLAQLGTMQIVYLYREITGGTQVGREVLEDLDYGSEFLLRLNEEWLDAYASPNPPQTWCFSLIGDDHSALDHQLFWQTHEDGSDGTVRISSGNLNYRMMSIDQNAPTPALSLKQLPFKVPHLILHGVTHTGDTGIISGTAPTMQLVYPYIQKALQISNPDDYKTLSGEWEQLSNQWTQQYREQCCSTVVFSLHHPGGRRVEDSLILIRDGNKPDLHESLMSVKASLEPRQPIQNDTVPSSVSFYVNHPRFESTYPHDVHIEINSGCDEITYPVVNYTVLKGSSTSVAPNEFAYVRIVLNREPDNTYELIPYSDNPNFRQKWPPLPKPKP